jgi:hypothetical protein
MGSSFANVQVLVRGRDSGTLRSAVVESLRAALASDGFVPVKEGEAVERTILIADDANWISIYDEVCDEQHQEELERLAMALSSGTGAHAMTVLVHASSVLELQWFDAGQRVDRFNSAPSYFARRPSDGFSFGGALAAPLSAEDPELPSLALWCDLENVSAERASAIQALAEELICEAMFQHAGIQALCGRATTDLVSHLDQTEYERNCDIHGPATLRRSWLSRFVRGVEVGCLWLGRQLVARVPDLEALHHAARVRAVAESLEVRIENEAALDAVEQALAPLLPSASDAQAASNRLYGC